MAESSPFGHKLRLLVNSSTGRVMYGEAEKGLVDFIFSLFTMPMGSVVEHLSTHTDDNGVGCLMNIYKSVEELNHMYMQNPAQKQELLHPQLYKTNSFLKIESTPSKASSANPIYYVCGPRPYDSMYNYNLQFRSSSHSASKVQNSRCECGLDRTNAVTLAKEEDTNNNDDKVAGSSGYVKDTVTFIVTDDLQVTPASTIFSIMLLNKLNVRDVSNLQERWVNVGYSEAVRLLKAALISKHALNHVFGVASREF